MEKAKTRMLPFDLTAIPAHSLRRIGERFRLGETKHDDNGKQWMRGAGDLKYQRERANHALWHLIQYSSGLTSNALDPDDHLAAVAWFCVTQMELERQEIERELDEGPVGSITPPPSSVKELAGSNNGLRVNYDLVRTSETDLEAIPTTPSNFALTWTDIPFHALKQASQAFIREQFSPGRKFYYSEKEGVEDIVMRDEGMQTPNYPRISGIPGDEK